MVEDGDDEPLLPVNAAAWSDRTASSLIPLGSVNQNEDLENYDWCKESWAAFEQEMIKGDGFYIIEGAGVMFRDFYDQFSKQ